MAGSGMPGEAVGENRRRESCMSDDNSNNNDDIPFNRDFPLKPGVVE